MAAGSHKHNWYCIARNTRKYFASLFLALFGTSNIRFPFRATHAHKHRAFCNHLNISFVSKDKRTLGASLIMGQSIPVSNLPFLERKLCSECLSTPRFIRWVPTSCKLYKGTRKPNKKPRKPYSGLNSTRTGVVVNTPRKHS